MTAPLNVALVTNSVIAAQTFFPGGAAALYGIATAWNAATATLQYLAQDNLTWLPTPYTLTANGFTTAPILPAGTYRAAVTGGAPTALYLNLAAIPLNLN